MLKLFEPHKIFSITSKAPRYVLLLFVIVLSVGLTEALILSPEDYKQSHSVRIMYVHVPAAWITLGIFSTITLLSISGYIFKIKKLRVEKVITIIIVLINKGKTICLPHEMHAIWTIKKMNVIA